MNTAGIVIHCFVLVAGDRQFASIMFAHEGEVIQATHLGMPFGAVSSVHAWHRIGLHVQFVPQCTSYAT